MKRVLTLCVFIAMVTAFLLPAYSAEVYMWVDEKGGKHITDQPPKKPAKMMYQDTYKRDSPEEIQRYQAEQKMNEQRREGESRQRQQINRAQEEAQKPRNNESTKRSIVDLEKNRLEDKRKTFGSWNEGMKILDKRKEELEKDPEQYFYNKEQRDKEAAARRVPASPVGAIDVRTGQVYSPAAGGVVDPRTGTFHQDVGGGYVDTKTGTFSPKIGR